MDDVRDRNALQPILRLAPAGLLALVAILAACGADPNDSSLPGYGIALQNGCIACHSTNGEAGVGPTWKGLFGATVTLENGSKVTVDRDYLVRAIKDPNAQVPQGNKVPMPVNQLGDADVQAIVDYIVSLR